jgi:hypothetical protein
VYEAVCGSVLGCESRGVEGVGEVEGIRRRKNAEDTGFTKAWLAKSRKRTRGAMYDMDVA